MAATALVSYLVIDIAGLAGAHTDPVGIDTAPWYYLGFLTVFAPGVMLGALARQAQARGKKL